MREHDDTTASCGDASDFPSSRDFLDYEDLTGQPVPWGLDYWCQFHSRKEFYELIDRVQRAAERYALSRADRF